MHLPPNREKAEFYAPAIIAIAAAMLLFWGLTDKYLWQDEAATAVLASRMLEYGKPLSYDGVNLITIDYSLLEDESDVTSRTGAPATSVDYYRKRGDYKPDTTWKWQPWGQFVVAAAGLKLLGHTTLGARLPFAIAAWLTVLLVYRMVRREFDSVMIATLTAILLLGNVYWILHARQCRYYSLSSLCLVLTWIGFARWQRGARWGATAFIAAAWCWFQVDYGTVWPVFGVLFAVALVEHRRKPWRVLGTGAILAATVLPFVYYYELAGRHSKPLDTWKERFTENLFNMNEYVAPALVVLFAVALLLLLWRDLPVASRRMLSTAVLTLVALAIWIPSVAPVAFLRYVIMAAPLGCMIAAWLLDRLLQRQPRWYIVLATAVLILTSWLSWPLHALCPPPDWYDGHPSFRPELLSLRHEVFAHPRDPNRMVIEWLRQNSKPTDEILISYEDIPLMFYLPNPIRGGIPTFRVEDDAKTPPRYAILRESAEELVQWPVFERELKRYRWEQMNVRIPDLVWGNNPDPVGQDLDSGTVDYIKVLRRVDTPAN